MGVCACGQPIGLIPRACRLEDRALLWPPVRINADGTEHVCQRERRRPIRVVDPIPEAVEAARLLEQASRETTAAVKRLADTLADESAARQDYYRQRAVRPPLAPRPWTGGVASPPVSEGGVAKPPAAKHEPERSLSSLLEGEAV